MPSYSSYHQLGLIENWKQFSILVLINAFVGGMVGLERTILPEIAEDEFGIAARSAIFSFIVVFGITKALANYFAGRFAQQYGRKNMLIVGWLFGLPVPFILMIAGSWNWIIFANVLLGINQGLAWSANVIMKIDIAGKKDRGLAMGLNEFAGYLAVGILAFLTGWMASEFGLRPYPFYLGIGLAVIGLTMSIVLVKDTEPWVNLESKGAGTKKSSENLFWRTSWGNRNLFAVTQSGLSTNLKDGMAWGAFPLYLSTAGLNLAQIGMITAIYPAFWGLFQVTTGKLSDYTGRKHMLVAGMFTQAASLLIFPFLSHFYAFLVTAAILGIGTAMVYPTFIATVADLVHPQDRAESIGAFRLWRDLGYAVGAVLTGLIADFYDLSLAITATGMITLISGLYIAVRMDSIEAPVSNH
ncbi:MFS transporter [Rhodohalobacter sp. 8-1]|uniref:MFS transporter n=1 Tax=Rhodohalobacter sp. 8-1 TaxID=3131972 RepID=UPI0030EF4622